MELSETGALAGGVVEMRAGHIRPLTHAESVSDDDDRGVLQLRGFHTVGDVGEGAAQHDLVRPRCERDHRDGTIGAVFGSEFYGQDTDAVIARCRTRLARIPATRVRASVSGIAVDRACVRVSTTVCTSSGTVSSVPSAAAAAA